ncbi:MAG: hypothetical protein AAFZ87_03815 [Planctomycetota bacterium]
MDDINLWAALGFAFAAYAVVGNDALQTLGTFINSNGRFHWSILFGFAATVLVVTFTYGWIVNDGDPSFGRLSNTDKYPPIESVEWFHVAPALGLLLMTRLGVPVSTSFMVLAIFATMGGIGKMIAKSLVGYGLAFAVGGALYLVLVKTVERHFRQNQESEFKPRWVVLQWLSTTWLWSVWLMQDFANIFVFLPRELGPVPAFGGLAIILVMLALTFANRGGPVQRVLRSKSSVSDIRSATIIDFTYAGLLYYFKEVSEIPMSTTWVFLGLIAGREYAFAALERHRTMLETARITLTDIAKAYIGLVVSIDMARGLPAMVQDQPLWTDPKGMWFFIGANVLVVPVALFLWRHTRNHSILLVASLAAGAALFFASLPLG